MDIKAEITKIVDKLKDDEKLLEKFKKDPVKAVESIIGIDLPDDILEKVENDFRAVNDKVKQCRSELRK